MNTTVILRILAFCLCVSVAAPVYAQMKAEGGANQADAQSGCMNQWMFNGMWRVRVLNVAPIPPGDVSGWDVTMQWANGTAFSNITPIDTGVQNMVLALANGDTLTTTDTSTGNLNEQKLDFHSFPAGGQFTYTQAFIITQSFDPNNKPAKLLITFDVQKYRAAHPAGTDKFWRQKTPAYNYRIDLTCSKS